MAIKLKSGGPVFIAELDALCRLIRKFIQKRYKTIYKPWRGEAGYEFNQVRPYYPGDDLRMVDWNLYRRTQELYIKEFSVEKPRHWIIALDNSKSMYLYNKFDFALKLSCALVYVGLNFLDRVSFITYTSPMMSMTGKGKNSYPKFVNIFNKLEAINTSEIDTKLLIPHISKHSQIIFIGDFYNIDFLKDLYILKAYSTQSTISHIIAKEEISPEIYGSINLKDIETLNTKKMSIDYYNIKKYKNKFAEHQKKVKKICISNFSSYLHFSPEDDIDQATLKILKSAGLLK